jgi:hypothetical protein
VSDFQKGDVVVVQKPKDHHSMNARAVFRAGQVGVITEIVLTPFMQSSEGFARVIFTDDKNESIDLENLKIADASNPPKREAK